ncbi:MAG: hypothetical protein IRZ15_14980 [Bryobacteraceae bacterium]|nr:hypothetical protein [Bryobacteraceae bacterium]
MRSISVSAGLGLRSGAAAILGTRCGFLLRIGFQPSLEGGLSLWRLWMLHVLVG